MPTPELSYARAPAPLAAASRALLAVALILCSLTLPIAQAADYTIQPGDQLRVLVYGTQGVSSLQGEGQQQPPTGTIQTLSETVTVLSDGTITYPLIGSIGIAGISPDAAAQRISTALAAYVIRPRVSVIVEKGTTASVKVLGSVDHGGQIDLQQGDRLVDAIAKAGVGPSSSADLNHITLNRTIGGVPHLYNINLYNLLLNADDSVNPVLQSGDVVYVPKAKKYDYSTWANVPFALYYLYLLLTPGANHSTTGIP
jgi:protein involved in polysaccharide export with SLBB domain